MKRSLYPFLSSSFHWAGLDENTTGTTNDITELENENNIPE